MPTTIINQMADAMVSGPAAANAAQSGADTMIEEGKKHPLEHKWTLWFDNPSGRQKKEAWGQTLRQVYTFGTVEDFWW